MNKYQDNSKGTAWWVALALAGVVAGCGGGGSDGNGGGNGALRIARLHLVRQAWYNEELGGHGDRDGPPAGGPAMHRSRHP